MHHNLAFINNNNKNNNIIIILSMKNINIILIIIILIKNIKRFKNFKYPQGNCFKKMWINNKKLLVAEWFRVQNTMTRDNYSHLIKIKTI